MSEEKLGTSWVGTKWVRGKRVRNDVRRVRPCKDLDFILSKMGAITGF